MSSQYVSFIYVYPFLQNAIVEYKVVPLKISIVSEMMFKELKTLFISTNNKLSK